MSPRATAEYVDGCPKYCADCHRQGACINSRRERGAVMRRYVCKGCGLRWTTLELNLDAIGTHEHVKLRAYRDAERRQAIAALRQDLDAAMNRFYASRVAF